MSYIADTIFDNGLTTIASATVRVDINYGTEATTYAEATSTKSCGSKTGLTTTAISNGVTDGRKVSTPAITDGTVSATQTAGFWAITDGASVLHATGALSATQAVTSGNTFTLDAINVTLRDA